VQLVAEPPPVQVAHEDEQAAHEPVAALAYSPPGQLARQVLLGLYRNVPETQFWHEVGEVDAHDRQGDVHSEHTVLLVK